MEDLKTFIQSEIAQLAFKKVGFGDSLIKSKILDSITVVDLLVAIEERTGKRIPHHLATEDNLDTIDKIVETLQTV